ncbi:MAG TPA: ATP-grasp domain-containing protein [Streptosporangiaceae bacterium]|jgi:biotin carboxylase
MDRDSVTPARRLLLVGMGSLGRPYLDRAHRKGLACAVLDLPGNAERACGLLGQGDAWYPVRDDTRESWYLAAGAALADGPADGVIGFGDPQVIPAALIAAELGLPGPGLLAALVSRNKLLSRELLARSGIAQPEFTSAGTAEEAIAWAAGGYPVVLKPPSGQGSLGVAVAADAGDIRRWASEPGRPASFLAERYLPGPELSCECVVVGGDVVFANVTEKTTTAPPYCVELAHQVPAPDAGLARDAETMTRAVAAAVGMTAGIIHVEVKAQPGGVHLVEFAVRMPGDRLMEVIRLATGVDLFDAMVDIAVGAPPDVTIRRHEAACVWFPQAPPGLVTAITGLDDIPALPGVVGSHLRFRQGGEVPPLRSSHDRLGWVLLTAADRAELAARLDAVRAALHVTVADPATVTSAAGPPLGGRR